MSHDDAERYRLIRNLQFASAQLDRARAELERWITQHDVAAGRRVRARRLEPATDRAPRA